ncbi:sel1 repeat family protein, partial [Escherichia coli]
MKACLLLFFYFSLIGQLHGADVKIKENESVMGSTAMTYDLSEEKLMKLKYKSQHGDSEASFRLYQ